MGSKRAVRDGWLASDLHDVEATVAIKGGVGGIHFEQCGEQPWPQEWQLGIIGGEEPGSPSVYPDDVTRKDPHHRAAERADQRAPTEGSVKGAVLNGAM